MTIYYARSHNTCVYFFHTFAELFNLEENFSLMGRHRSCPSFFTNEILLNIWKFQTNSGNILHSESNERQRHFQCRSCSKIKSSVAFFNLNRILYYQMWEVNDILSYFPHSSFGTLQFSVAFAIFSCELCFDFRTAVSKTLPSSIKYRILLIFYYLFEFVVEFCFSNRRSVCDRASLLGLTSAFGQISAEFFHNYWYSSVEYDRFCLVMDIY
jgi:hypothetical protein